MPDVVLPLADRLAALARCQDGVLTRRDVLSAGGSPALIVRRTRSGEWCPLLRGTYLVEPWRYGAELQRSWARAACLSIEGSVIGLRTAAALHGIEGARRRGLVDVVVDRPVRAQRRLSPHQFRLGPHDVVDLEGLRTTSIARTVADLVLQVDRLQALSVMDSVLRLPSTPAGVLEVAARLAAGRPGSLAVRDLWARADAPAENPLESRMRLRCIDADLVPDELQYEVLDEHGHVVARADAMFRRKDPTRLPLLLEADGHGPHEAPVALYRDRRRTNDLVAMRYDVVRCTWEDTLSRLAIPTMVRRAL